MDPEKTFYLKNLTKKEHLINSLIIDSAVALEENKTLIIILENRIKELRKDNHSTDLVALLEKIKHQTEIGTYHAEELQRMSHISTETNHGEEAGEKSDEEMAVMNPKDGIRMKNFLTLESLSTEAIHLTELYLEELNKTYPEEYDLILSGLQRLKRPTRN